LNTVFPEILHRMYAVYVQYGIYSKRHKGLYCIVYKSQINIERHKYNLNEKTYSAMVGYSTFNYIQYTCLKYKVIHRTKKTQLNTNIIRNNTTAFCEMKCDVCCCVP